MGFIRVRSAGGPLHEFDVSEAAYKRNKRAFTVVDKTPVAVSRPVKYLAAPVAKSAGKPAEEKE